MPVTIVYPHVIDAAAGAHLIESVRETIRRWRPPFESWKLAVVRSQSGDGWDLAISGPHVRTVFTLHGPLDDLPGLVCAHVDAILAQRRAARA